MSRKQSRATKQTKAALAAERAAAVRHEQQKKDRRRRTIVVTAVVVGVLAVIVVVSAVVQAARDTPGDGPGQVAGAPDGTVGEYAVALDSADAPVIVEVYEDFMCPACGQFEASAGDTLEEYAASEDVQVQYRPISFLDSASNGARYSTRAMNALGVVLDGAGPAAAVEMHDALFADQPAEGTDGLSDAKLVDLAVESGADRAAVTGPIENVKFEKWVSDATDVSQNEGVASTPTVVVNGEQLTDNSVESLTEAVERARPETPPG